MFPERDVMSGTGHLPLNAKVESRRLCPICGRGSRQFAPYGDPARAEAQCMGCLSLERHRLVWLYFVRRSRLFEDRTERVLHVAPEPCLEQRLRAALGTGYVTADYSDPRVDFRIDIMNIACRDKTFDFIYCSHVLEHVADDRKAMREFHRILRHGGQAVLLVPITAGRYTFEDEAITDPIERARAFGQHDHVRSYGEDYTERLTEAGFEVEVLTVADLAVDDEAVRMNLSAAAGSIHVCRRRA